MYLVLLRRADNDVEVNTAGHTFSTVPQEYAVYRVPQCSGELLAVSCTQLRKFGKSKKTIKEKEKKLDLREIHAPPDVTVLRILPHQLF